MLFVILRRTKMETWADQIGLALPVCTTPDYFFGKGFPA
jgi:hypothetical protein